MKTEIINTNNENDKSYSKFEQFENELVEIGFDKLTKQQRVELIEHASLDDYKQVIDIIHEYFTKDTDINRQPSSTPIKLVRRDGTISAYTASPEERDEILNRALENSKVLINKFKHEGGDIDDLLERCSNLAAFGTVLSHAYVDGNGRTSRVLGYLISHGFDPKDKDSGEDLKKIGSNRNLEGYRIYSYVPSGEWGGETHEANKRPLDFLDYIAGASIPFDNEDYRKAVGNSFTTPFKP